MRVYNVKSESPVSGLLASAMLTIAVPEPEVTFPDPDVSEKNLRIWSPPAYRRGMDWAPTPGEVYEGFYDDGVFNCADWSDWQFGWDDSDSSSDSGNDTSYTDDAGSDWDGWDTDSAEDQGNLPDNN